MKKQKDVLSNLFLQKGIFKNWIFIILLPVVLICACGTFPADVSEEAALLKNVESITGETTDIEELALREIASEEIVSDESASKEEQKTQEQITEEESTQEQITEEESTQEQITEEESTQEQITEEQSTQEQIKEEQIKEEQIKEEQPSEEQITNNQTTQEQITDESRMEVHFIDVGQGDCTLIICDGEAMLIDAGNNSKGTAIQLYLKKQGIEALKYVICTHPDADHIGGMDVILYKYECNTIIMPNVSNDTNTYRDIIDVLDNKGYMITYPVVGNEYSIGKAKFVILGPGKGYSDDNNDSVSIRLSHGNNSFLFTGDALEEAENDYIKTGIELASTVLKTGHHGSSSSTGIGFLKAVSPQYAVISCGAENIYGHPHSETLNNLRKQGCQVFRTDEQGSIIATSDEKKLTWNCSPSETWKAGEVKGSPVIIPNDAANQVEEVKQNTVPVSSDVQYILNTNTKKFHYPSCASVKSMKDKNKKETAESREEIISQGYAPCKRCNP